MKLHIGGTARKEGWTILDVEERPEVDVIANAEQLPFEDGSAEAIYASHVLEHFSLATVPKVLREWNRVLVRGGQLYLSVPDLDKLNILMLKERSGDGKLLLMRMMFGGQTNAYDFHYVGLYWEILRQFLQESGFSQASKVEPFGLFEDCSSLKFRNQLISLNVLARK